MPNVSGIVYYNANNLIAAGPGIQNVPVVLYNTGTGQGAIALTDVNGAYLFTNVPAGNYHIIESWGTLGGLATPVNYATSAIPMAQPAEAVPPLSAISVAPPALADNLMAITPHLLAVTVAASDISGKNFYDGPVGDKPLTFVNVTQSGPNLITVADNGTWGNYAAGAAINQPVPSDPYPGVTPGFTYVNDLNPRDGYFTVMNTRGVSQFWWGSSDHTTRLETGRMLLVNGANPGAIIFTQTTNVNADTYYSLTGWIQNLMLPSWPGYESPQLAFEILDANGNVLAYQVVNPIDQTPIPVWYQNGFIFNSEANTTVTVRLISNGAAAAGNDYLIDDVQMYQVNLIDQISVKKVASPDIIYPGSDVTFTITVTNTSAAIAKNVSFKDVLDPSLTFTAGSVQVNGSGTGYGSANPNTGFSLGDMAPGAVDIVTFHAIASAGPSPVLNTASGAYDILNSGNGDIQQQTVMSNPFYLVRLANNFEQASSDLTESIALEETALAHIINAEGEKIQAAIASSNVTAQQLIDINDSVENTLAAINRLEMILGDKFEIVKCQIVNDLNC